MSAAGVLPSIVFPKKKKKKSNEIRNNISLGEIIEYK